MHSSRHICLCVKDTALAAHGARASSNTRTIPGLRPPPRGSYTVRSAPYASKISNVLECTAMQRLRLLSATVALVAVAAFPAQPADDVKPPPAGSRHVPGAGRWRLDAVGRLGGKRGNGNEGDGRGQQAQSLHGGALQYIGNLARIGRASHSVGPARRGTQSGD